MVYSRTARLATSLAAAVTTACGGGSGPSVPPPPPAPQLAKATTSGDEQVGQANATLPQPLRVIVTQGGTPIASREVTWQVQNGGSVNPATTTTGADGIASTVVTLGSQPIMTISAASAGAGGSPVAFTALAATAAATVQVNNNVFVPQTVAIRAGGRVTFDWPNGSSQHNLIPDEGKDRPNDAVVRNGPFTVEVVFPTPGDYFYHCSVHGGTRSGMFGKVVVVP
ncbi:MAG: plastocyanin/azurin family copper-binding protein [Gemmatimonadales bacterium]